MVRSFLTNGRKHYWTHSARKHRDHARRQSCNTALQASLAQLSKELSNNPKTVAKWRKMATVEDLNLGPNYPWTNGQVERMNRPSRRQLLNASIMNTIARCGNTLPTSWQPTTLPAGSRPSTGLRPMNMSARSGHLSQTNSS